MVFSAVLQGAAGYLVTIHINDILFPELRTKGNYETQDEALESLRYDLSCLGLVVSRLNRASCIKFLLNRKLVYQVNN